MIRRTRRLRRLPFAPSRGGSLRRLPGSRSNPRGGTGGARQISRCQGGSAVGPGMQIGLGDRGSGPGSCGLDRRPG
eukprot:735803-Prorocentrum_minimum.AAC.1